jgi:hypothetical protein
MRRRYPPKTHSIAHSYLPEKHRLTSDAKLLRCRDKTSGSGKAGRTDFSGSTPEACIDDPRYIELAVMVHEESIGLTGDAELTGRSDETSGGSKI